jgi:hypothetical protein
LPVLYEEDGMPRGQRFPLAVMLERAVREHLELREEALPLDGDSRMKSVRTCVAFRERTSGGGR